MLLPTQLPSQLPSQPLPTDARALDGHPPLLSQGLFKLLSNVDTSSNLHRRYAELSDPPDLFGSLSEEQIPPPPEDMNPEDPEMTPREQDLRFEGDLYTPRWVRGHGNKREGWCGICKPGRWLPFGTTNLSLTASVLLPERHSRNPLRLGEWTGTLTFGRAYAQAAMIGLLWSAARRRARLGSVMLTSATHTQKPKALPSAAARTASEEGVPAEGTQRLQRWAGWTTLATDLQHRTP